LFTPSKSQVGTIAFEDLWPYYGDYDFNDVALNYQVVLKLNAKVWLFKWILSVMLNQTELVLRTEYELEILSHLK
jgi:LruC domain-containing protein